MSLVKTKSDKAAFPYPENCFYCGKKVQPPFVHWMGAGEGFSTVGHDISLAMHIVFHPQCVGKLTHRLLNDVESIQGCNQ